MNSASFSESSLGPSHINHRHFVCLRSTLAGFILWRLGHLPHEGETFIAGDLAFEVVKLDGRNIDKVRIRHVEDVA